MRVLMLATYFPKPGKMAVGPWALDQAKALVAEGMDLRVISCTTWVPRWMGIIPKARAWASVPPAAVLDGVDVRYPRVPLYHGRHGGLWRWIVRRRPAWQMRVIWAVARSRLLHEIRDFKPDILYAHHTEVSGYLAARLHKRTGLPYAITDHDFDEIQDCAVMPARRKMYTQVIGDAACMVAVASRMEKNVQNLFPGARTATVHNGIAPPPAQSDKTPRPPELAGRTVVFSASMFNYRKALPLLIAAFAAAAKTRPNSVLRIAGGGPDQAEVEAAVRAEGLGEQIQLIGLLPKAQVLQEMAWCDLFALVGWDEPFGVVYAEAMAAGKPIICCNDGGINDLVTNGLQGITVPPRDAGAVTAALGKLLDDAALRRRMGEAGRALYQGKLTWEMNARRMRELFEEAQKLRG